MASTASPVNASPGANSGPTQSQNALSSPAPSAAQQGIPSGLRYPSTGKTIYHRPLHRSRTQELSQASFAYLFAEMVSYAQRKVTGIADLEKRYANGRGCLY